MAELPLELQKGAMEYLRSVGSEIHDISASGSMAMNR
jgi:hypothetical protein